MIPFFSSYHFPKGSSLVPIALIGLMWIAGCGLVGNDDKKPRLPGTLVFSAMDESDEYQVYSMKPDGSRRKRLTDPDFKYGPGEDNVPFHGLNPAWSPDGQRIVFETFYKASSIGPSLWVMNFDGSNPRPLYHPNPDDIHQVALMGNNPRWSPDGTKVAFHMCVNCSVGTQYLIFVFDTLTKELNQLSEFPAQDMYPEWSPDGTRIAFVSNREYINADTMRWRQDLYVVDINTGEQTRLTQTGFVTFPRWSPDGNFIAYEWNINGNDIFLYDVTTGQTRRLETGLKYSSGPLLWNRESSGLLVFGRRDDGFEVEMRLIHLGSSDPKILKTIPLTASMIGNGYDWHN